MVKTLTRLETVDAVIEALGGYPGTMAVTGAAQNAVSMWVHRGAFPAHMHYVVTTALAPLGFDAAPALFNQTLPDSAPKEAAAAAS